MYTISELAKQRIKGNHKIIGSLMVIFDRHQKTINEWIDKKDIRLATPSAMEIIQEGTGLSKKEILEKQNTTQVSKLQ